jgi:hypothetical protein
MSGTIREVLDLILGSPRNNNPPDDDSDAHSSVSSQHDPDDDYVPAGPVAAIDTAPFAALRVSTRATSATVNVAAPAAPIAAANVAAPTVPIVPSPYLLPPPRRIMLSNNHAYPHPDLDPLVEPVNPTNLRPLFNQVTNNLRSVNSTLGGGNNGHEYLFHDDNAYIALPGNPTACRLPPMPVYPTDAQFIAAGAAAPLLLRRYDHEIAVRELHFKTEAEVKQQFIKAVPPVYLAKLAAKHGGIGNCTILQIKEHLVTDYGTPTAVDRQANLDRLDMPFDASKPIELFWTNINTVVAIAKEHGDTIKEETVILHVLRSLEKDGHFKDEVKKWRLTKEADWKLAPFIADITAVHNLSPLTAGAAGYHGANSAVVAPSTATAAAVAAPSVKASAASYPPGVTAIADSENPGKIFLVCYCSIHGGQNAKKIASGGAHTNENCPDKAKPDWKKGATLMDRRGGNQNMYFGRQGGQSSKSN